MSIQLLLCGETINSVPDKMLKPYLDMRGRVKVKGYLPQKLKQLLLLMSTEAVAHRLTSAEALNRAEEIFKDVYGRSKVYRVRHVPPCVEACAQLDCGQCRASNSTEISCKGMGSCIVQGTGSNVTCSTEEPKHRVRTTSAKARFPKGARGTVVEYLDNGAAMLVKLDGPTLDGQHEPIRIGKLFLEDVN